MTVLLGRRLNGRPYLVRLNLGTIAADDTGVAIGLLGLDGGTGSPPVTSPVYATGFSISSPNSLTSGVPATLTIAPTGGVWNGQTVTPAATGVTGSFVPTSAVGSGTNALSFQFTPSSTGSGTISATAQGLTSAGAQSITVAQSGGGTTPVTADWDALTPYNQVALGWKNASTSSLAQPFVMTNHRSQRADVPAGSHLQLFKADGTAITTQQDNEAPTHLDGSQVSASIAAILPDTLAPIGSSGDTGSYFVKAVSGAPNRTPKFSLASWAAQNDLKLRISTNIANLSDATQQFEFRVSDAVSAGLYEGSSNGTDYPLTSIRVDRSGPVCMGWKFKGFARRVSDGAYHRTLTGELYVTAVSLTDNLIDGMFKMPMGNTVGQNSLQTVGSTSGDDLSPLIGVVQLMNGNTVLHTWGGSTDYRATAVTADTTNNFLVFPTTGVGRSRNALSYVLSSTGSLPGGLVANVPYCMQQDYNPQNCRVLTNRSFHQYAGNISPYQPNHAYGLWDAYSSVTTTGATDLSGQLYACVQAGTTANSPPSGTAFNQVDGTVKWSPMNIKLTSAGSGTITAWPVVHIYPTTGAAFVDELTTDPVWTGSGVAPRVEAIKDVHYLNKYARAFPPYDETLTPLYETGLPFDGFSVSEPYVQATIDFFGDDPGTNLIGYLNISASNALLNQASVQVQRHQRAEALGWSDHWLYLEDARSLQPIVGNLGPGNQAGRYPGLAPGLTSFWFDYRGVGSGFLGLGNSLQQGYSSARYGTMLDGSHLPAFWTLSYEKTARSIFLDQGIALANGCMLSSYKGNGAQTSKNTIGSRSYYNTTLINQQQRGCGWTTRAIDCLDDVLPAAHIMRPYISDMLQDGLDFAIAVIADNQANRPQNYALGYLRGPDTDGGAAGIQMWFMAFMLTAIAQAARKARNPGWRTVGEHIATRFFLPVYDDDNGGNAGLIDWNLFSGIHSFQVHSDVTAGDTFTIVGDPDPYGLSAASQNVYTLPAAITYTATAGQTPAQVASSICALINNTPSTRDFGWVATDDDTGGYFRTNQPGSVFNDANNHADVGLNITGRAISRSGNQVMNLGRIDTNGPPGLRTKFSTIPEMLTYNIGPGWNQAAQGKVSLAATGPGLKGPAGRIPWDTTDYPNIIWAATATMVEAGFPRARVIYDRMTSRIQATGGGPTFSFVPYSRFSPDGTGRTYNNFNLVAYHLQATRTQH